MNVTHRWIALTLALLPARTLAAQRPTPRPTETPRRAESPTSPTPSRSAVTIDRGWRPRLWSALGDDFTNDVTRNFSRDFALTFSPEVSLDFAVDRAMNRAVEQALDGRRLADEALATLDVVTPNLDGRLDARLAMTMEDGIARGLAHSPAVRFPAPGDWHAAARWREPLLSSVQGPWLQGDPADSLYRQARELLNNGEYRRAAAAFRDLSSRMPTSGYAADALYWQAFALYRIGGTAELRSAIDALEQQKDKYPGARLKTESEALSLRIRGALASRGDAAAAATLRTAAGDSALRCDREELAVRLEALNALTQSDPDGAMPVLQKTLARRDSCSTLMRRTAVFLIGSRRRDASGVAMLTQVARNDPSVEVRASALDWLARSPGDEALATIEALARDDSDERVQRAAVRALVANATPRARQLVRGIVERNETPERLRIEALGAFDKDRATAEDITWMRTLYARTDNDRVKARIVNTLANIGGADVDQWLLAMARNADERSETRRYALRRVGRTLPIVELSRLYDSASERPIREMLIETLAQRAEGEATDKLLDIVRTGTDPQLRSRAISALTSRKDPRTLRLLMEIIDK